MRLKQYIKENRSQPIKLEEAMNTMERHCMKALKSNWSIYRGNDQLYDAFYFISPGKSMPRESPYATNNIYNELLSNLHSWKKYPQRNKSLICSTSFQTGNRYGGDYPYLVLPFDRSKVGVCPKSDIWYSFKDFPMLGRPAGLNELNVQMSYLFKNIIGMTSYDTYDEIVKNCNKIDSIRDNWVDEDEDNEGHTYTFEEYVYDKVDSDCVDFFIKNVRYLYQKNVTLLGVLEKALDPEYNGFSIKKVGEGMVHNDLEVWTDGDCLMIKMDREVIEHLGDFQKYINMENV